MLEFELKIHASLLGFCAQTCQTKLDGPYVMSTRLGLHNLSLRFLDVHMQHDRSSDTICQVGKQIPLMET